MGFLLEKRKRRLTRPRTGKLSELSSSQRLGEPCERAKRREGARNTKTKTRGGERGDGEFDGICKPINWL